MKYISVNKLTDFEFHDSELSLEIFDNNSLKVKATYLNIHKGTEQNHHEADMEIESAFITFDGFSLLSYEPGRAWQQDENGEFYTTDAQIILEGNSAHSRFLTQLKSGLTIFDLDIKEGDTYFIDAMSKDPFFTVFFTFKSICIEWDSYKREAWYTSNE